LYETISASMSSRTAAQYRVGRDRPHRSCHADRALAKRRRKYLVLMTLRHVVVPYPGTNSTVRVRALHWVDRLLAQNRIESDETIVHGPGFSRRSVPRGEPLLLLRNASRLTRGKREARLLRRASYGVYDLDDGLPWDDGRLPRLGRWWKRPFPRSLVAERSAAAADMIVVGNEVLADWASAHRSEVRVIPTCIEPSDYATRSNWDVGEQPVIGWIGSRATEPYLLDIADSLAEVHRRTGATVQIVSGEGSVHSSLAPFTSRTLWRPDSTKSIADWDVAIMPLHDGQYERAKCGYKLLQYAASGVPAVASPVGVNATILQAMDGLAATTSDEWTEALCELIAEPADRRRRRADRGLIVAQEYSYDTWQDRWIEAVGWQCASST
jgi:glycosyltransferase involved in cell wall biosynthesis